MDTQLVWVIGSLSAAGATLLGILYKLIGNNTEKIAEHDVLFAKLERVPDALDTLSDKISNLTVDVAVIKDKLENK